MIGNLKPLIIVAHFDDEVLSCSSLFKYNPNIIIVCGNNTRKDIALQIRKDLKEKHNYNINYYFLDYSYFELKDYCQNEIIDHLKNEINGIDFNAVFTHSNKDLHLDHKIINNAVNVLFRSNRFYGKNIKLLAEFDTEFYSNENLIIEVNQDFKQDMLNYYKEIIDKDHLSSHKSYINYISKKYNLDNSCESFNIKYLKCLE